MVEMADFGLDSSIAMFADHSPGIIYTGLVECHLRIVGV